MMLRSIELLYLLTINVIAPLFLKTLAFLIPAMQAQFWAMVVFFVVLQCMNIFRLMQNRTLFWRITYGALIALNIAAFTFLMHLSVFSTPIAVLEIIRSMQK
jgi:hypothetical protein